MSEQKRKYPRVSGDEWRRAMGNFPSGVAIVACVDSRKQPWGMTVASLCSLSMRPPLLLTCMDGDAPTLPRVLESGYFSVNILREDQEDMSDRFAVVPDSERFIGLPWHPGPGGLPLIDGALVTIECRLDNQVTGGDHTILIGKPLNIQHGNDDHRPLLYWRGKYLRLTS